MSVETFIRAMPKVELGVNLEGAAPRETLLMLADQNEMGEQVKHFDRWLQQFDEPDFKTLDSLTAMIRSWMQYPDDLTRAVYDLGVALSKQNIRYAEVSVHPLSHVTGDFTFGEFIEVLNDGRSRAERAWGIQLRWVMVVPRNEPRRADEIARWATSATARQGGVVGLELEGREKPQSLDQFERAFNNAAKKDLHRSGHIGEKDDISEAIELLQLARVIDGWGLLDSPETVALMVERGVSLSVGIGRAKALGWVNEHSEYPLQALIESGLSLTLGADMPTIYRHTICDEYLAAVDDCGLSLDMLEALALNAVQESCMEPDEQANLTMELMQAYADLKAEHLSEEEPAEE